jgi:hypothetical protein
LDPLAGPAWRLYLNGGKGISVYPSVWRDNGCKSHYVIWRGKIYLFGRYENEMEGQENRKEILAIAESLRANLPKNALIYHEAIAENLNLVPWDVLLACRELVRDGRAREGIGKMRGWFGLA